MAVEDINAKKLRTLLTSKNKIEIIDVREPDEYKIIHLKGSKLIPMNELPGKLNEIDWDNEVVFICRTGARSKLMADLVAKTGMEVKNLKYGIYECFKDEKCTDLEILEDEIEGYFR